MLKINDNVDLKILEKYGDEDNKIHLNVSCTNYVFEEWWHELFGENCCHTIFSINKYSRIICMYDTTDTALDVLYDLIQDGLVEKV